MEISIKILEDDDLFLELCFINISVNSYTVLVDPPLEGLEKMEEVEEKKFSDRDYRFLLITPANLAKLRKFNCKLKVIAEDEEGRTFYSDIVEV